MDACQPRSDTHGESLEKCFFRRMRIGNGQKNYPDGLKDPNPDDLTVRSFICGQVIRFFYRSHHRLLVCQPLN